MNFWQQNNPMINLLANYSQISSQMIHYVTYGSGPPLLLLHGMGGSIMDWEENIEMLSQQYKVFALDIPGFGKSPPPALAAHINLSYLAKLLHDFIGAERLQRVFLVGQSLGGGLAIEFALRYPEYLIKLVLVDSAGFGKEVTWQVRIQSVKLIHRILLELASRRTVEKTWASMFFDRAYATETIVSRTWNWLQKPETKRFLLEAHANAANLCGQRRIFLPELHKIQIPTLVIWGANDVVFPLSHAHAAHQYIHNSILQIFPKCGHIPQIEKADEFNHSVLEFFSRQYA